MRLLHRINLDVPAGEEYQFRAVIGHPDVLAAFEHDLVYGNTIHPVLAPDILPFLDSAVSFKQAGRWRLPRWPAWLRERRFAARVENCKADAILAWSGFARDLLSQASRTTGVPLLYREGGGAWNDRSPAAAGRFVAELDGAICNTHASMRMLQLKWGYDGPARVCREGVRPDLLAAADASAPRPLGERPVIGVAARLAAGKGVCLALHALRHLRDQGVDARLRIAGDGPDRDQLRDLGEHLGLADAIEWLGSVEDMAAFYTSIDVLLHPTLHEALGNVTIEASAFGVPVVATRVDGMAETVLHEQTGRTVPASEPMSAYGQYGGDADTVLASQIYDPDADALRPVGFALPQALAEAVAAIVADPADHTRMGAAAAAHVRETFSYARYITAFIETVRMFVHGTSLQGAGTSGRSDARS